MILSFTFYRKLKCCAPSLSTHLGISCWWARNTQLYAFMMSTLSNVSCPATLWISTQTPSAESVTIPAPTATSPVAKMAASNCGTECLTGAWPPLRKPTTALRSARPSSPKTPSTFCPAERILLPNSGKFPQAGLWSSTQVRWRIMGRVRLWIKLWAWWRIMSRFYPSNRVSVFHFEQSQFLFSSNGPKTIFSAMVTFYLRCEFCILY